MENLAPRWMTRRVGNVLEHLAEADFERMLVAGAVVARQGDHFWIVSGAESSAELADLAARISSAQLVAAAR
jgi:hypothetical protein